MQIIFLLFLLLNFIYWALLADLKRNWITLVTKFNTVKSTEFLPLISLVIPVRNEEEYIDYLIAQLINLDYPKDKIAIIFVDDHSEDATFVKLQSNKQKLDFQILKSNGTGKKSALQTGVEFAKTDWIVTTDADVHFDVLWLKNMFDYSNLEDIAMICGVVLIDQSEVNKSFLYTFQRLEFAMLQASGAGSLKRGNPLLNSGANLAFKKSNWEKVGGYKSHSHIASGDDTFLMIEFKRAFGDCILSNVNSSVKTRPVNSWKALFNQRLRWSGKSKYYKDNYIVFIGILVMLSSLPIPFLLFYIQDIELGLYFLTALTLRFIAEYSFLKEWDRKYRLNTSFFSALKMSLFYPLFLLFLTLLTPFKKNSWKGRTM